MIGKSQKQFSILDGALNSRSKHSRSDKLLREMDSFINRNQIEAVRGGVYKDSNRGRTYKGSQPEADPPLAERNRPLSKKQRKDNNQKSAVRNEVERPFAYFSAGGGSVFRKHYNGFRRFRYVNLARNALHFTFLCIIYNIRRGIAITVSKI